MKSVRIAAVRADWLRYRSYYLSCLASHYAYGLGGGWKVWDVS